MILRFFVGKIFQKNKNWCVKPEDFKIPNKIQLREHSRSGGVDGFIHENDRALGSERQLEQRWLERQCQLGDESERVE